MRGLAILCLMAFASVGSAHADDCANPTTQTTMSICAGKAFQRADRKLNDLYKTIRGRLKDDANASKLLVAAQRDWIAFRDAECAFASSGTTGGSIHPMIYANCEERLTKARIADFKTYLACEEGDLSCPVPPR